MNVILRYDNKVDVTTQLNPIEDLLSWVSGLSSIGYTSDILNTVHGVPGIREIRKSAQEIALYARNAIGFVEQAYAGPDDVSFLPLYYAVLNLSKIYIVLSGRRRQLIRNRYHGASYDATGKSSRDILTEELTLRRGGVLPLFHETLTGVAWSEGDKKLRLSDIYPYIRGIVHEYQHAYGRPSALQCIRLCMEGNPSDGYRLAAFLAKDTPHRGAGKKRYLKVLKAFRPIAQSFPSPFVQPGLQCVFASRRVLSKTEDKARESLLGYVNRYLLYEPIADYKGELVGSFTPLCSKALLLPEEIPIWIAFFHLSNIVRYNPEFLGRIKDSKSWPMLLALRRHTLLRYLVIFWSYLHQTTFKLFME